MAVERTRQQKTPANFGPGVTTLSNVDTSSANFVRQGVVDQSSSVGLKTGAAIAKATGELGSTAIKAAAEFRDGFQLAEHQANIESNIQDYIESKKNPQIAAEAEVDLSALDTMSNGLWAQLGNGASIEDIDAIDKRFQDTLGRYKKAVDQGVMTPDDFAMRSLALTREAVNRNPALHNEIINHTKKIMNLSGMDSLLKAEQEAQKSQGKILEERIKDNQTFLYSQFVMPKYNRDGSYDLDRNEAAAQAIAQERFAADAIQRQGNIRNEIEAGQAADWMSKYGIQGVNGVITNTTNAAIQLLANPENKGNQLGAVRLMFQNTLLDLQQKAGPISHLPGPKGALDFAEKRVNAALEMLNKFASNEDAAEYFKNVSSVARDQDNIALMKVVSPAAVEMSTKMLAAMGPAGLMMRNTELYTKSQATFSNLLDMTTNNPTTDYKLNLPTGKNAISEGVRVLAADANKGDDKAIDSLQKYVKTIYADTKNEKFSTPQDKFLFYDKYMKELGNPGTGKMDMEAVGKASENLEEYMNMTLSSFQSDVDKIGKRGVGVRMEVIGDGRLGIVTDNPADTEMLVKKYGIRINNGLRAFSSLSNSSTKESADRFYSAYPALKIVTQKAEGETTGRRIANVQPRGTKVNPPNESNPFNLIIPGKAGNFQKFKSEQQGIVEASKQLLRYQTKGSPIDGKKLNTVREIAQVWNNENEEGSASSQTYLNTIINNSKLNPDEQLNLNDLDTIVSLMFGMAKAEGNPLTKREIRLAVEGERL